MNMEISASYLDCSGCLTCNCCCMTNVCITDDESALRCSVSLIRGQSDLPTLYIVIINERAKIDCDIGPHNIHGGRIAWESGEGAVIVLKPAIGDLQSVHCGCATTINADT